jgi:hypothetical protein
MPEPFEGFDSTHAYHRPNSRGETIRRSVRLPKDEVRAIQIIQESGHWPFKTSTDVILDALYIGLQTRLASLDTQTPIGEMMKMRSTFDAMQVERDSVAASSQDLTTAWSMARTDEERAKIIAAARSALPHFSPDVRERLTRMLGL